LIVFTVPCTAAHVAGEEGIEMALNAIVDVLQHAHGITDEQIVRVAKQGVKIVATPMGTIQSN
jgi:imidazolonepropionase-like amidohydrolase